MSKPGRNDPCPCGSGKKYKNCCLNKDRTRRVRSSAWRHEEQVTLDKLLAFGQRPEFHGQLAVASNLFWNGSYGLEGLNALHRDEVGRFLDWYLCDYRLEAEARDLPGEGKRQRIIDLFVEETATQLLAGERERLAVWQNSHLSLYRIARPPAEDSLELRDVLQDTEASVGGDGWGRLGLPGDLLLGRLFLSSEPAHLSWGTILLPASMEEGLSSFIRQTFVRHRQAYAQTTWPGFLSEFGYLFNHYLLKAAAEAEPGRSARGAYHDASESMVKLAEVERVLRERRAKEAAKRRQEEQQRPGAGAESLRSPFDKAQGRAQDIALRQTRGGILLPEYVQYKGSKERKP
jgi:hypothetical protein